MKVLYIGNEVKERPKTGGEYINYRNFNILNKIYGIDNVSKIELSICGEMIKTGSFLKKIEIVSNILRKYLAGLDQKTENYILRNIEKNNYDCIFLGTSQIGRLAYKIKKLFPKINIITFFHNIEYQYFQELVKKEGIIKNPLVWAAKYNETIATKYSDKVITLNNRDNILMKNLFGRETDLELPTTLIDVYKDNELNKKNVKKPIELLFVGSNFFANYEGMKWFILNVLPYVQANLTVVGKGMDTYKHEFVGHNINIVGMVECLDEYYYNSDIVISPIFSGGGMKTKTAEALMYAKTIFGTTESFEGYILDYGQIGEVCNTASEYIDKLNVWIEKNKITKFNAISRKNFIERYSFECSVKQYEKLYINYK